MSFDPSFRSPATRRGADKHQPPSLRQTMVDKENDQGRPPPATPLPSKNSSLPKTPSTSKLLRNASSTKRRHLSGAMRIPAGQPRMLGARLGYDGTMSTPSRELLRSTHASRAQRRYLSPQSDRCRNPLADTLEQESVSSARSSPPSPVMEPPLHVKRPRPHRL